MLLYVLFGLAGILTIVFIVIFFQYCRTYRMVKQEELDGLVSSRVTPEEYEVSVRCRGASYSVNPFNATCSKLLLFKGSSAILV